MRDHRAQHRAHDGFVRETFTQPRDDARQTVREFLDRYPKPAYMSEVEHWRELSGGEIRVHDEAAANGSLNGTTPKSDSRIVHEETCGNCRRCRSSIAHRLECGDACICSPTKGVRYCQNEVAFLRSPNGGRPRRKVRRAHVRARCRGFLRKRKR